MAYHHHSAVSPIHHHRYLAALVFRLVDHRIFSDPRHHCAQPTTDFFEPMFTGDAAFRLQSGLPSLAFVHKVGDKNARLYIF